MTGTTEVLTTHNQFKCMVGSGLPKIQQGWTDQGHSLTIHDSLKPYDQTIAELTWGGLASSEKTPEKTPEKSLKTPEKILALVKNRPEITIQELARDIGKSTSAIERALGKLKAEQKLRRIGADKGGHWEIIE
jgi:predicted HTH transcriptional regulator